MRLKIEGQANERVALEILSLTMYLALNNNYYSLPKLEHLL